MPIKVAFEHLRSIGRVHTQKDVGESMNVGKENISRAFNGVDGYSPGFVRRFNETFGNIFNEDFLLTGEGEMLKGTTTSLSKAPSMEKSTVHENTR